MSCNKTFANHPKQTTQFKEGDRVVRIKDGKEGTFKYERVSDSWKFEMDDGESLYLCGWAHANWPWRIPNRFNLKTDANERICELLDMIVEERVKTEDYNYVVEALTAMISPTAA